MHKVISYHLSRVALFCLLLVSGGVLHAQAPAFVTMSGSHLTDSTGAPVSNATLCAQPTLNPQGPSTSATALGGGQITKPAVCAAVNAGAFSITLANTYTANPQNFCYAVTITDNASQAILLDAGYSCVQPTSNPSSAWCATSGGTTVCNFDMYPINLLPQVAVQAGPIGPNGSPGCVVGNGACQTVVSTTPAASQTVTQPANTTLSLNGTTLLNGKNACLADGSRCRSDAGSMVGMSADGSTLADNGSSEKFLADLHPVGINADKSIMAPGWDTESDVYLRQGHWNCLSCTNPAYMVRALSSQGGANSNATSYTAQATMYFGSNSQNCIGFSNAAYGAVSTTEAQRVRTCFSSTGWTVTVGGTTTPLATLPTANTSYDVTMFITNNQIILSAVQTGTDTARTGFIQAASSAPGNIPSGLENFEVFSANALDEQSNIRYGASNVLYSTVLPIPNSDSVANLESEPTSNTAGTTWVAIPKNYRPGKANKWVIYEHGYNEVGWNISGGGNTGVQAVTGFLLDAGYVVIGINNTFQNCYGNAQCMTDIANVVSEWQAKLSLAPQPYIMAESMGGFAMLNSVARGVLSPRAIVGMCINTDLAWDYISGNAAAAEQAAFNFTSSAQYAAATAGYDPNLASGTMLANLVNTPTMLWSSYSDTTVSRANNTDEYATKISAAGGSVIVQTSTGGHEDLSNFNGPAVVAFFNAH